MDEDRCLWCGQPASKYCDAVIGIDPVDEQMRVGLLNVQRTCDAPMCRHHGRQVGWVCGQDPDSIDRCPYHADVGHKKLEGLVMVKSESERKRREIHAAIRRENFMTIIISGAER